MVARQQAQTPVAAMRSDAVVRHDSVRTLQEIRDDIDLRIKATDDSPNCLCESHNGGSASIRGGAAGGARRGVGENGEVPRNAQTSLPPYPRPLELALVFAGGVVGVLARELLILAIPDAGGVPLAVLLANVVGSFVLGVLLEALAASGDESAPRRALRLFFGTGLLGGFTTYSALAQSVVLMLDGSALPLALGYGFGSLVAGALAAWLGVAAGSRLGGGGRA